MLITAAEYVAPTSDENVTVTDTEFSNVAVRLYLPRRASDGLRRAVVYFHGGGWCVGQAGKLFSVSARGPYGRSQRPVLSAAFCFTGVATERVRELVCHRLKLGGGFGKSPERFCEEERAVVYVSVYWSIF